MENSFFPSLSITTTPERAVLLLDVLPNRQNTRFCSVSAPCLSFTAKKRKSAAELIPFHRNDKTKPPCVFHGKKTKKGGVINPVSSERQGNTPPPKRGVARHLLPFNALTCTTVTPPRKSQRSFRILIKTARVSSSVQRQEKNNPIQLPPTINRGRGKQKNIAFSVFHAKPL